MKHVLILNRYDDELSDFRRYVDHAENRVSYISLIGRSRLIERALCANVVEVSSLDGDTVLPAARLLHETQPIDAVLAFSEYDLDAAALVRSALNIPGAKEADNALCRNKASMKAALAASSVRYPYYQSVASRDDVERFCHQHGFPAILKPQVGAASDGVVKLESDADIPALEDFAGYEVEEYIEGDIYHVDAILAAGQMPYFKVSKYLNTCLDFRHGAPLGSVTVDNAAFIARAQAVTKEVCAHLNLRNQAIHLELIARCDELVFLEIGGRVGGGEIPFITLRNEDTDLFKLWSQAALGEAIKPVNTRITGFLMVPNPYPGGFVFDENLELTHPLLTWQNIRQRGGNSGFSYEEIPARLHFMGKNQAEVEHAIRQCMLTLQQAMSPLADGGNP